MTVLVTGATGTTGRRVADLLDAELPGPESPGAESPGAELPGTGRAPVRRVSRSSPIRFDWADPATHDPVFDGVDRLYLMAPVGDPEPATAVRPVLERAVARGLRRVVLLSSSAVVRGEGGLGELIDLVATVAPEPVVLRPSWFTQNLLGDHAAARGLRSGTLVTATGDGRLPFVDAGDIAAVAVRALLDEPLPAADLVVTGPEALGYADVCALWTELTGQAARHVPVTPAELADRLAADGMPPEFASVLAGLDELIASGTQATVTDVVPALTGRPARSVREVLTEALPAPA